MAMDTQKNKYYSKIYLEAKANKCTSLVHFVPLLQIFLFEINFLDMNEIKLDVSQGINFIIF